MQVCQVLTFVGTVGLSCVLKPGMFGWIYFYFFLVGIFSTASMPFLLELACEVRAGLAPLGRRCRVAHGLL